MLKHELSEGMVAVGASWHTLDNKVPTVPTRARHEAAY